MRLAVLSIVTILFYLRFGPLPTAASVPVPLGLLVATLVTGWGALRRRRRHAALAFPVLLAATAGTIMGPVDVSVSSRAELGVRVVPVSYGLMVSSRPYRANSRPSSNRGCMVPLYPKKWTIQVGLAPVDPQRLQRLGRIDELALPLRSREADRIAAAAWAAVLVDEEVADEGLAILFSDLERKINRLDGEPGLSSRDLYRAAPNQWGGNDQAMDEVLDEVIRISPAFDRVRREFSGIEGTSILWLTDDSDREHWPSRALSALGANAVAVPPELGLDYWLDSEPVDFLIVDGDTNAEGFDRLMLRMKLGELPPVILYRPLETSQQLAEQPGIEQAGSPEELLLTVLEIAERLRLLREAAR